MGMPNRFKLFALAIAVSIVAACGGGGGEVDTLKIVGFFPSMGTPGEHVVILGKDFSPFGNGTTTVEFNGVEATVLSLTNTRIEAIVPVGVTTGPLNVKNELAGDISLDNFTVGARITVPEAEPNDDNLGADATNVGLNDTCSGTLTANDTDHFLFDCVIPGASHHVKVTPGVVTQVFVNGNAVNLDANGEGDFTAPADGKALIALTVGTGAYTVHVSLN